MNERLKQLRTTLKLTQQAFADRIGMRQNTVAQYEIGRTLPSSAIVLSICREFNVSESWLRDGIGEMFVPEPDDVLDLLAAEYRLNRAAYVVVEKFIRLRPEEQEQILRYFTAVADGIRSEASEP